MPQPVKPIVTMVGYRLSFILSGTIVVETVFAWPGIGQLFFTSIDRLDYQVVQARSTDRRPTRVILATSFLATRLS